MGQRRRHINFYIGLFIATRTVLFSGVRMIYPFLPVLARGLGVPIERVAVVISTRSLTAVLNPLMTPYSDNRGRKAGMLLGLGVFTGFNLLIALVPRYWAFFLGTCGAMVGINIYLYTLQAFLGDAVPYERRGRVQGLSELAWSFSYFLMMPLLALLISRSGWTAPYKVLAVLGALLVALSAWQLPRDVRSGPPGAGSGLWKRLYQVFSYPPALAGLFLGLFMSMGNEFISLMFGVWMEDDFGMKIAALGAASAVIGLAEMGGEGLMAGLTDRLGKRRSIRIGLAANCAASLALYLLGGRLWTALLGLFLFYLTFEFSIVSMLPLMTQVLPESRATMMGMNYAFYGIGRATAALLAPWLYGLGFVFCIGGVVLANLVSLWLLAGVRVRHVPEEAGAAV